MIISRSAQMTFFLQPFFVTWGLGLIIRLIISETGKTLLAAKLMVQLLVIVLLYFRSSILCFGVIIVGSRRLGIACSPAFFLETSCTLLN